MPSNLVWSWPLHPNSNISYVFMEKDDLNRKRGHAIIGFNHGLPCYVKNMALGAQSRQKPRPTASVFVYLSPLGHVFNIAWQAMIKTYNNSRRQAVACVTMGSACHPPSWRQCRYSLLWLCLNPQLIHPKNNILYVYGDWWFHINYFDSDKSLFLH